MPPTTVQELRPEQWACGNTTFALTTPYHTHQVIELPPIAMDVTHWVLHQGWCPDVRPLEESPGACRVCERAMVRASVPSMGELAGTYGNGRRMVQTLCASVLQVPISLGAIQKILDRVTQAIDPYYVAMATQARQSSVNSIDETSWFCMNTLHWLWVMASERVAFYMIHPRRSKEAFAALIEDWAGLLVSDGYGVYQTPGWRRGKPAWRICIRTRTRLGRTPASRPGRLRCVGVGRVATAVSYGHSPTHRGGNGGPGMRGCVS